MFLANHLAKAAPIHDPLYFLLTTICLFSFFQRLISVLNLIFFLLQGFMCSGSKSKLSPLDMVMEGKSPNQEDQISSKGSVLLELSASDDLNGFRCEVEEKGFDVDTLGLWYGRRIGSKKMGFEERTPLSIAAMFGSIEVLKYIIGNGEADVNKACGSDRVTALHCATAGGSDSSLDAVKLLLQMNSRSTSPCRT